MNDEEAEFIAAVLKGLKALDEGRVLSHEEVKARFKPPAADER
jgi:predicted transcriptional regulator